ncbi:hypothetical protein U9M48_000860 [Paspalum notatum var. saurae]|uniref:Uncharacterized protein n=1 Tax=Paspalum notatum var. saurae TaxID=547442 RepID=A0AAQ3PHI0_PASNO
MRRCAPGLRRVGEAMPASRRGRALELITGVKMPYPMVEGQLAFQVNVPKTEKTYCKNKECRKHTVQKVTRYKMVRPSLSSRRRPSPLPSAAAAAVATLPPGGCGRGSEVDVDGKLVQQPADVVRRLARQKDRKGDTPMHLTAHFNRVEILEVMLDFDQSLGYVTSEWNGNVPLLFSAASRGHVEFARALLKH